MKRRDFLKGVVAVSTMATCVSTESSVASHTIPQVKPKASDLKERVVLAGLTKGSSRRGNKISRSGIGSCSN